MQVLSVIIPVYNEISTISEFLERVQAAPAGPGIEKEIIIIDDGSTDGTREFLAAAGKHFRLLPQDRNRGKGAAVRKGLAVSTGDYAVIQDADLEYDPEEYEKLLQPILAGHADVVFGSRFLHGRPQAESRWHYLVNKLLTALSNLVNGTHLTDMETCYKMLSRKVAIDIGPRLISDRFEIEPELTARIVRAGYRIAEVGISYRQRSYKEGKKIGWKDGVRTLIAIARFGTLRR